MGRQRQQQSIIMFNFRSDALNHRGRAKRECLGRFSSWREEFPIGVHAGDRFKCLRLRRRRPDDGPIRSEFTSAALGSVNNEQFRQDSAESESEHKRKNEVFIIRFVFTATRTSLLELLSDRFVGVRCGDVKKVIREIIEIEAEAETRLNNVKIIWERSDCSAFLLSIVPIRHQSSSAPIRCAR